MRIFFKKVLIFILIVTLLLTNTNISGTASVIGTENFYQMKNEQENTKDEDTTERHDENNSIIESDTSEEERKEEVTIENNETESKEEEATIENKKTESVETTEIIKQTEKTTEAKKEEDRSEKTLQTSEVERKKEEKYFEPEKMGEGNVPVVQSTHPDTNHSVTMPDVTSHYFLLQKNSKKIAQATGKNLVKVTDQKMASKYIYESHPNGKQYNFTPRFGVGSSVSVGGGSGGGVSFATVKKGGRKQFGDVYSATESGTVISKVFNLQKCTTNPYAIYKKVGTWYDYNTKKSYMIDTKITVTGYKFPGAEVRKQLANKELKAPYIGFKKNAIGLYVMGTDYVQTRIEFFYTGT